MHQARAAVAVLLIGLVLSVSGAIAFALLTEDMHFDAAATAQSRREAWQHADADEAEWIDKIWRAPGLTVQFVRADRNADQVEVTHRAGWPWPVLQGRVIISGSTSLIENVQGAVDMDNDLTMQLFIGGASTPAAVETTPKILPLTPAWPGILVNTIAAALVLVAFAVPARVMQRTFRSLRGHCPKCGYDLRRRLDNGCSECGWKRSVA